ncbi:head-tail connector protein [Pseudalkalibacillus sp. JSM 102089]|uniref:head-tail connector protein n=1 Tax=Pseudalkalibacillus sp. JSM 102089 TaxID=3229856 RepID=UPI0035265600
MIVDLVEMKQYLRLEIADDEEDEMIESFLLVADEYLKSATGFKFETDVPERAKLIIKLLVSHWYDNRAVVAPNIVMNKIHFTVDALIFQLTYSHVEEDLIQ